MQVKVLKYFTDIHTGAGREPGTTITVSEERFAEMQKNLGEGYVEVVPSPKKPKAKE